MVVGLTVIVILGSVMKVIGLPPEAAVLLAPLAIIVPPTVYLVLSAIVSALFSRQAVPGICSQCGYDLRATPHRCPECGTIPIQSRTQAVEGNPN